MPACAAVEPVPDAVGTYLPAQVYLKRGVDRDHAPILRDDEGVVDVIGGVQFDHGVVVRPVEESLCAEEEAGDEFAAMDGFCFAVDHAGFDEIDDAIGEEFGVDAEVAFVSKRVEYGVGDGTDAELEGGTIGDGVGDVTTDLLGDRAGVALGGFAQGAIGFDAGVNVGYVDEAVAEGAGHAGVDFGDHDACDLRGGECAANVNAK